MGWVLHPFQSEARISQKQALASFWSQRGYLSEVWIHGGAAFFPRKAAQWCIIFPCFGKWTTCLIGIWIKWRHLGAVPELLNINRNYNIKTIKLQIKINVTGKINCKLTKKCWITFGSLFISIHSFSHFYICRCSKALFHNFKITLKWPDPISRS